MGPLLKPFKVPLDGNPSLKQTSSTTKLGVIQKLAEGTLNPSVYVTDENIKYYLSHYKLLRDMTCYCFLFGH